MIKAFYIKEADSYDVNLPGGEWMIRIDQKDPIFIEADRGGKKVEIKGEFTVHEVKRNSIITHYENAFNGCLPQSEYEKKKLELIKLGVEDEEYSDVYDFNNIDDEYNYKKFLKEWTPIRKPTITYGDSEPIEYFSVQLDAGNKFITPMYSVNGDPSLYIFDKLNAGNKILQETMEELGMIFGGKVDHKETKDRKTWGNSFDSGLRFVTAFGHYIFNDSFDFTKNKTRRGTLDLMKAEYESLRNEIREVVISGYKAHFGEFDKSKVEIFAQNIIIDLDNLRSRVMGLEVKRNSGTSLGFVLQGVNEIKRKAVDLFI